MNQKVLFFLPVFFILVSCSSTPTSQTHLANEARHEDVSGDSSETEAQLIAILNQDASVTREERTQVISIIKKEYGRYHQLEKLANQKKSLLIREYVKSNPDKNRVRDLKNGIKQLYGQKSDLMINAFDKIAKIMKLHPASSEKFFDSASSFWPMRDRAP